MKKYKIGYTQGVYDMFHVGHLNLLNHAKQHCETLIVGVNSDELVKKYKKKCPIINENDRAAIISNIKAVDQCIIVYTLDKLEILNHIQFNAVFIGDDWKGSPRWEQTVKDLGNYNIDVVFLPHTPDISSTILRSQHSDAVIDIICEQERTRI